jgi:hypothetical protein
MQYATSIPLEWCPEEAVFVTEDPSSSSEGEAEPEQHQHTSSAASPTLAAAAATPVSPAVAVQFAKTEFASVKTPTPAPLAAALKTALQQLPPPAPPQAPPVALSALNPSNIKGFDMVPAHALAVAIQESNLLSYYNPAELPQLSEERMAELLHSIFPDRPNRGLSICLQHMRRLQQAQVRFRSISELLRVLFGTFL